MDSNVEAARKSQRTARALLRECWSALAYLERSGSLPLPELKAILTELQAWNVADAQIASADALIAKQDTRITVLEAALMDVWYLSCKAPDADEVALAIGGRVRDAIGGKELERRIRERGADADGEGEARG